MMRVNVKEWWKVWCYTEDRVRSGQDNNTIPATPDDGRSPSRRRRYMNMCVQRRIRIYIYSHAHVHTHTQARTRTGTRTRTRTRTHKTFVNFHCKFSQYSVYRIGFSLCLRPFLLLFFAMLTALRLFLPGTRGHGERGPDARAATGPYRMTGIHI